MGNEDNEGVLAVTTIVRRRESESRWDSYLVLSQSMDAGDQVDWNLPPVSD